MTIEKGAQWGSPADETGSLPVARSDYELARLVEESRATASVFRLTGGDLFRTLGRPRDLVHPWAFPVDAVRLIVDEEHERLFVAHAVARSAFWSHSFVAMNAQWLGGWNVGHRAHPNDGFVDCYSAVLSPSDRLVVRPRLALGSHMPHPSIRYMRLKSHLVEMERPRLIIADGKKVGRGRRISVSVVPDAASVVVG